MKKITYFLSIALGLLIALGFSINSSAKQEDKSAKPESTVPWEYPDSTYKKLQVQSADRPLIADISKWQGNIDWSKAGKALDLVIIRTQDGVLTEDYMHSSYEANAERYNVPFGVYSFVRAGTPSEARAEARTFYNRASKKTQFYVLDVEVKTNRNGYSMREVINAYEDEMRKLTNKKIGLYVANHLYNSFQLNTSAFDFVWIPRYGPTPPGPKHHLWQYTSRGSVPGIAGNVDLNYLANDTKLEFFTNKVAQISTDKLVKKYYVTNPKYVLLKQKANIYKKKDFSSKVKNGSYNVGDVVKVKRITKSSAGIPHLELTNGQFITASKSFVLKTSASTQNDFYTAADKVTQIMAIRDLQSYTTASYTSSSKGEYVPIYTILNVSKLSYSGNGKLRFQILSGRFISANKADVVAVPDTIENYYREPLKDLQTIKNVYMYNDVLFGDESTKELIPIGTNIQIEELVYNKLGFPRYRLTNGKYVSTKKSLYKKISWMEQ